MSVARHRIEGGAGVGLAARVAGPLGAPSVLFLHGWSQHSLAFQKQLEGPLAERFRLGAIDLRGHGASDKPEDPAAYLASPLWADDVAAAISGLQLDRPVLVGWSMGAWVAADYLRHYGDAGVAGLVLIGASARAGALADPLGFARRAVAEAAPQPEAQDAWIEAAIAFAKAMTAAPLSKPDLARMVAWQMLAGPVARAACRARQDDWRADLAAIGVPALVIQGAAERVCPRDTHLELMKALPGGSEAVIYAGSGHMPFWEEPVRFDADLSGLVVRAGGAEARAGGPAH